MSDTSSPENLHRMATAAIRCLHDAVARPGVLLDLADQLRDAADSIQDSGADLTVAAELLELVDSVEVWDADTTAARAIIDGTDTDTILADELLSIADTLEREADEANPTADVVGGGILPVECLDAEGCGCDGDQCAELSDLRTMRVWDGFGGPNIWIDVTVRVSRDRRGRINGFRDVLDGEAGAAWWSAPQTVPLYPADLDAFLDLYGDWMLMELDPRAF